jgi:hypothetical protein
MNPPIKTELNKRRQRSSEERAGPFGGASSSSGRCEDGSLIRRRHNVGPITGRAGAEPRSVTGTIPPARSGSSAGYVTRLVAGSVIRNCKQDREDYCEECERREDRHRQPPPLASNSLQDADCRDQHEQSRADEEGNVFGEPKVLKDLGMVRIPWPPAPVKVI